ncbi:quinone-dependent dihydroorotate dehydrogenase [Leptolyngbya sp. NK1-12]|uniref:Dihydroorotate dehydrogenase (quinone) n=1 Tax=Leptolyngbya sp. NK1-12 TaxID=2547451 RepID=A0AA97AG03_9CYAN|nr:quinone-dependent dihydroorotate dehydrogenase [Leptolyngbya sp. NK1-12]WNZ23760.1 quinone-dependent dihydroorotate dehydrogenase [Leptolyngbya sp. NK1-12]
MDIYKFGLRPLLFSGLKADPEQIHHQMLQVLSRLDDQPNHPLAHWAKLVLSQSCRFYHPALIQSLWGLSFVNPIGLAAGFDKDGVATGLWSAFGFGFAELGTVTLHAQPGNPPPRLFRLPLDQAALNRMGFNNQGAAALAKRLERQRQRWIDREETNLIPLGVNLGKSKVTPLEAAAVDYLESFRLLQHLGDYFVVNVSSPNTPGLRSLQAADQLDPILKALQQENQAKKPLLVKIAPDLDWEEIEAVIELAQTHRLAGLIATNTTIRRDQLTTQTIAATGNPVSAEAGGISGAPLRSRATEVIRFIYQQTEGKLPIIGVGGIFDAEDAWEKLTAGASLLQVYTGWLYEGPWMVQRILKGLVEKLEAHGLSHISEATGLSEKAGI